MSAIERLAAEKVRRQLARASAAGKDDDLPPGSPYLYALACAYLAAPEGDTDHERKLEELFTEQADDEDADGDEILTVLAGVEVLS